jgi:hypothetical protein
MSCESARTLAILAALFCSILVFIFLPSEIYSRNPLEFVSTPTLLLENLVPIGLLLATILFLPVLIPLSTWQKIYATFLGSAFLGLWVSSVFLVADFGMLDGTSFNLSVHTRILAFHSAWFCLALVSCAIGIWRWPQEMTRAIIFIGIGLLVIGAVNFYTANTNQEGRWESVSVTDISRFSREQNLLIVLMDTFQSDVLQQIVEQGPEVDDQLDGFLFYPDTLGVAPSTYLTMPAFHSGKGYDGNMSLSEYYDLGVREGSFLTKLAQNGYQVDIINPIAGACPREISTCRRQESLLLHAREVTEVESSRLADLGLFRAMPGLSKQWVFDGTSGPVTRIRNDVPLSGLEQRIYQGNTVLKLVTENLWADNGPPTAKFLHLFNSHPPYMFDDACQFIGVTKVLDRAHMTQQIRCAMSWVFILMEKMKATGVYDNTMIILMADTGAGSIYGADDLSSLYAQQHGVKPGDLGRLIGGANPVLAIKFPNEHGSLQESTVQAQLTDIPRTVCEALQECSIKDGANLINVDTTSRKRIYNYYQFKHEYWGLDHIPGIVKYAINGPLWLESSWSRETPPKEPQQVANVSFSDQDQPEIFGTGWSYPEVSDAGISKRWSTADKAEMFLTLPIGVDVTLEFQVLSAPGLNNQVMSINLNGELVGSRRLDDRVQHVTVTVPKRMITKPTSDLLLEFSQVREPDSKSERRLSVSFYRLNIYSTAEP